MSSTELVFSELAVLVQNQKMQKDSKLDRSLVVYYFSFLCGCLLLAYEALGLNWVGDSVSLILVLCFVQGFFVRRRLHILESGFLFTVGYILPLMIRNSLKMPSGSISATGAFFELAMMSSSATLLFAMMGISIVPIIKFLTQRIDSRLGRGRIKF